MGVEDRYKKKKEEESKSNTLYNGVENRYLSQGIETIGKDIEDRINTWLTNNKNYIDNAQYRFSDKNNSYRADSSDWLTTVTKQRENFGLEADSIKKVLTTYKDFFGEEYVSSVFKALDENLKIQDSVIEASTNDRDHWSQWDSYDAWKKDYDAAIAWQKDYDEKMSYDLTAGKTEIDRLNNILGVKDEITKLKNDIAILNQVKSDPYGTHRKEKEEKIKRLEAMEATWAHAMQVYGSEDALRAMASEKGAYYTLAQRVQEGAKLGGVSDPNSEYYDPNFAKYSSIGNTVSWENVGDKTNKNGIAIYDDLKAATLVMNERLLGKELYSENMVTPKEGILGYFEGLKGLSEYNTENTETVNIFREMEDSEVSTLAYYLQKDKENGTNLAEQYVASLRETLNGRVAKKIAESKETDFSKYLFAVEAGIDQFFEGRDALFSGADYIPPSATQQASGIIREELADTGIPVWYNFATGQWENQILGSSTGQIFYDSLNTTANMLPSVLASTLTSLVNPALGGWVGSAALGMSAAGNAKAEMLNLGYSKSQANAYGIMVGASEVLLEKFLGGIPGISNGDGIFSSLGEKILGKIDNAFARAAITIGGNMLDEGLEEGLQTILEPWLKEVATSVDFDAPNIDEVLYSSLLGALSSIGFGAADVVGGKINSNLQTNAYGQSIIDNGNVDSLKQLALEMYTDKSIAEQKKGIKLSEKVDKNASAKNVGKLATYIEGTATKQNETAIMKALTEKGLSAKVATKAAQYIMDSGKLSKIDKATIEGSSKIQKAINEVRETVNLDESDVSSRLQDAVGTRQKAIKEIAERLAVAQTEADIDSEAGAKFEASDNGKTVFIDAQGNARDVNIKKVASTKGGLKVELEDGITVNASDISFGTKEEALMYEMVARMEVTPETANEIISTFKPSDVGQATRYFSTIPLAYQYGKMGYEAGLKNVALPDNLKKIAYNRGRVDAMSQAKTKTKAVTKKGSNKASTNKSGIIFENGYVYDEAKANDLQKASMAGIEVIDKMSNLEVHVFESKVEGGKRVAYVNGKLVAAPNGYFRDGNRIYIDINAGNGGEGAMLYTMGHEVGHYIRQWNAEGFKELGDFLLKEYGKKGVPVNVLLNAQKEKIKKRYREERKPLPSEAKLADMAYEELVCDAMSDMFTDSQAYEKLAKLKQKNRTLWEKLGEAIKALLDKIKTALGVYKEKDAPVAQEAYLVRGFSMEAYDKLQDLYIKAFVQADENYGASGVSESTQTESEAKYSYSSIAYSFFGDDNISIEDMENGSYKKTEGYKQYVAQCLNNMRQSVEGFSEKVALKEIRDSIDGIVEVAVAMKKAGYDILDSEGGRNIRDSKKRLLFSSLEPNSDYFTSSDISTICDKRINFAEIYDEIVRREDAMGVPKSKRFFNNIDNYFVLHKILADKGLTAPCRQCYVESMRKNLDPMANAFIELMQEKNPDNKANKQLYQPSGKNKGALKSNNAKLRENLLEVIEREQYDITADDLTIKMLTTADGLAQLKLQAPLIYEAFNSFYGQSKPKMPKAATPFRFGELTALLTDDKGKIKKGLIEKIKSTGGFRLQSYSDFQIQNFADVLQVIFEAGTLGLNGHAYTKVPAFLDATKGTNLKRNISIFMYKDGGQWKIDRGDSFPYELEKIYDIVNADESGNTGIIAVVQNEDMAAWIMANDNVGYFIPFHKSGVKMGVVRETIVREGGREIKGYSGIKDHTRQQTEVWAKATADHKANTKVKKGINIYEFWDFENVDNLSQKELIEKNVKEYVNRCNEAGYLPKFREYVMGNGKVLNKVLAYAKELGFVSQNATIDDISFEYSGYRIPYGYYKCLGDFGMFTPDGEASPIERLSLKDYNFNEAVKFFSDAETLRRNEILQQFENGFEREKYRNSDMTTAELAEEVQKRRNQVVDEVVSGEYKNAKYSDRASTYSELDKWFESLSIEELEQLMSDNSSIDDISEELNVPKKRIEILIRRKGLGESHIEANRTAVMKQARIDEAIEDSGAKHHPDYARKYITRISPKDFIDLTVSQNHLDRGQFDAEVKGDYGSRMSEYDYKKALQDSRSPYLSVDRSTGKVIGHNGRHRIRALEMAGVEAVEIEVQFFDEDGDLIKYNANTIPDMAISSQFDTAIETHLSTIIPLNEAHRAEIERTYGEKAHPDAGVKYSDREISSVTEEEYKALEKHFGTTGNFKVAGYLLPDGKLLDFSGKHWGDTSSRSRQVDHRDVQEVLNRGNNGISDMVDMIGSGSIRLMPEIGGINLAVYPNEKQRRMLSLYIKQMLATEGQVIIDYDSVGGDTVYSREYDKYASSSQILSDIRNYFNNGGRQSELMRFHTEFSDADTMYSIREEAPPKKTMEGYKVFVVKNGKLYPPMVANPNAEDTPVGVWLNADVGTRAPDSKTGRMQVKAGGKGTQGGSGSLAFRPGWHLGETPLATQFDRLNPETGVKELFPENFVWALCDIAADHDYQEEAMSYGYTKNGKFQHSLAGLPKLPTDGYYKYRTNPNPDTVPWLITGAMKVKRLLSDAEVNEILVSKGLSPKQRVGGNKTLADLGLAEYEDVVYSERDINSVSNRSLLAGALESVAQNDIEKNKLSQYKEKIALIEAEQKKLGEIRAKANELRFTKGRTSAETKQMRDLDAEATQIANRISTYDKQLLNLESTKALKNVLEREKAMLKKKLEQQSRKAISEQKQKDAKTVREIMNRYQESRSKAVEGRHKTEVRHKIKKVVSDLNKLLLNPTKEKHVPIGLQLPVAEALDAINMDTMNAEERVAYYNDLISKSSDPDEIEMLTKKRDFFEYRDATFKERITALKNAYAEFKESDDPLIRNAHNDAIEDLIKNTADAVGKKSLKDMSLAQLEAVYNMYKAVLATVRNANKMFKEGRQETVTENSVAVKNEVRDVGGHQDRVLKLAKFFKKFGWDMLKPVTAMKVIGSKTFERLFNNVRAGEDTWAVDVNEAKEFYEGVSKKYGFKKWDFKKRYNFKDSGGSDFSLSLEQIMSLYAYSKRDQADKHLEFGGFIFDDAIEVTEKKLGIPLKYEVNDANPYRFRKEDLLAITDSLTKEQKAFVDEMQAYLSDVMGAKGNEVSLAMYDIKLYNEKNYFPLKTSRYFREFDPEKSGTPKIKNSGFSKKTIPQAGNPIVLSNFMDVWAGHVNDMSMYHAFVLPLEDLLRVYNYSSTAGGYDSVQQYIKNAYGAQANQYIERLMDDLNGGARVDSSAGVINKGLSLFKKASVFASASVVVQQPSAIARAFAYINPKYFATSAPSAMNLKKHKTVWAEVKKYAPVAVIKEMGYFDTGVGRSTIEWLKGNQTIKDKMDDALSKAPAMADELVWAHLWEAVKRETKATTNLKWGSEEFLKKCGERFTEVITNTQVYDSVLSRSGMMRSKDTGMKMATAFMAEPTTTVNMMVDGIIQGKRGNKKFTAATVGAVASSIILNSILVALVYAARDDDEDETYTEKYIGSVTSELLDGFNPLTYVPFIKDIWSIAQGYDVERSDMSVVSKLWESVEGLFKEDKSGWEKVLDVSGSVSSLFGIPLKNIIRDAKGMYNLTLTLTSGTQTTGAGISESVEDSFKSSIPLWDRLTESKSNADRLYEAILSGDQVQIERIKNRYKDEKAIESAMRQALRDNDPRIKEAAQARYEGDISEYTRIAKQIIAQGKFSQDTIVAAINAELNAIKRGEVTEVVETEDEDEVTSIYSSSDINVAFNNGDTDMALEIINDLIETKMANGMEEKNARSSIKSSITSYWKPLYKQAYEMGDSAEMYRIRTILLASGLYGSANDVVKTVWNWVKS